MKLQIRGKSIPGEINAIRDILSSEDYPRTSSGLICPLILEDRMAHRFAIKLFCSRKIFKQDRLNDNFLMSILKFTIKLYY